MQAATAPTPVDGRSLPGAGIMDAGRAFTRHALTHVRIISCGHAVDGAVLCLFAWAGTVHWVPVAAYAVMGVLLAIFWTTVFHNGWTLGAKDPHLPTALCLSHQMLRLAGMALMPALSAVFLFNLLVVFAWLVMRSGPRQAVAACALTCLGAALVLAAVGAPVRIPAGNTVERMLSWAAMSLSLWQCLRMGRVNGAMTATLRHRGHELATLTRRAAYLGRHDELTGLLNRRSVLAMLAQEQQHADRTGQRLTVALVDLDHFKDLNETLGHEAGDRALRMFATTVRQLARASDHIGRYSGDAFLAVLTDTGTDGARIPIQRFREALKARGWDAVAPGLEVTFSCGLAAHRDGESAEELLARADDALRQAKRDGRDCTCSG